MDTAQIAVVVSSVSALISAFSAYLTWSTRRSVIKAGLPRFRLYDDKAADGSVQFMLQNLGKLTAVDIRVCVQSRGDHHDRWSYTQGHEILIPEKGEVLLQAPDFPSHKTRSDCSEYQIGDFWEGATCYVTWRDPAGKHNLLSSGAFVDVRTKDL